MEKVKHILPSYGLVKLFAIRLKRFDKRIIEIAKAMFLKTEKEELEDARKIQVKVTGNRTLMMCLLIITR